MTRSEHPRSEPERLDALRRARILDTPPEESFNDLVDIAAAICQVPYALVSLVDADRQWFKARRGMDVEQTSRKDSFCTHSLLQPDRMMVVPDVRDDPRFHDNPFVTGPTRIRFYAGMPLLDPDGVPLGSFCVMDDKPRELDRGQLDALQALSRQASRLIELRRLSWELEHHLRERAWYEEQLRQYHTTLERENLSLARMSMTDPLTGLPNRRAFTAELDVMRDESRPYAVAICDLDHFKQINDTHGHAVGDRVLVAVAGVLRSQHAARGRVARVGGEEFVVLLPDVDRDDALRQCEALRRAVEALRVEVPVTVSIGVAGAAPGEAPEAAFARADAALYAAKRGGRNRVAAG